MLKRMRLKFVIVIMSIVTILFGAIFYGIIHFTKQNIERESIQIMRGITFTPPAPVPLKPIEPVENIPENMPNNMRMPFFRISIDKNGIITTFGGDYYDLSDENFVEKLLEIVEENKDETGIISEYNLRYMKNNSPLGLSVTFADISNEQMMIRGLIRNSLIIGFVAYVLFFGVSLLLAKWVTKPVEKAWNEQKKFIADASHELKTPLTVIMTNAEMLTDTDYSENERKGFTKNILSMSKRMRGLVESLLELARIDNGAAKTVSEKINFSKLVMSCILPFEPLFYEKNMELSVNAENSLCVVGDKSKLKQVVDILLDNALKYSENNVSVNLKSQGNHVLLSVAGNGKPLSKSECKDIFKRFYRADESRNDGSSYGLGLSIAESIITEHGGKIWAESYNSINIFYILL